MQDFFRKLSVLIAKYGSDGVARHTFAAGDDELAAAQPGVCGHALPFALAHAHLQGTLFPHPVQELLGGQGPDQTGILPADMAEHGFHQLVNQPGIPGRRFDRRFIPQLSNPRSQLSEGMLMDPVFIVDHQYEDLGDQQLLLQWHFQKGTDQSQRASPLPVSLPTEGRAGPGCRGRAWCRPDTAGR